MKLRIAALAAAGVLGATAFAAGGIAGPEYKNQYPTNKDVLLKACPDNDATDDRVLYTGPTTMWPPNHKIQDTLVAAVGDSDDDVTLRVSGAVDDVAGGDGGTRHDPDIFFAPLLPGTGEGTENPAVGYNSDSDGTTDVITSLRAERSGKSGADGERIYNISWTATFEDGEGDCSGSFSVRVPHDMSDPEDRAGRTNGN